MIASLTGFVQAKASGSLVVDVAGVGYLVSVPAQLAAIQAVGDKVTLHTALIVREDAFLLFGFSSAEQLALFDLLRSVTGVGPKLALGILSTLSAEQIANAVVNEDAVSFQSVTGVGAKTAKLIAVTLAGKLKPASAGQGDTAASILETLKSLGWSEKQASAAIRIALEQNSNGDVATLIRTALLILGKN